MKQRHLFLKGILSLVLVFGLVLAGCDGGGGTGGGSIPSNQGYNQEDDQGDNQGDNNNGGTSKPSTPTEVKASRNSATPTTITVSWKAVSRATSYKVYYSVSGSGSGTLDGTSSATSYNSTDNRTDVTWYFKVSAVNSAGEGSPSSWVSVGPVSGGGGGGGTTVPNAPTGVTASAQSSSSIMVSWNAVSDATSYNVYIARSSSGPYIESGTSATTSFTSSGWNSSTTAYFRVTAVNSAGESPQSSTASATTLSSGGGGTSYGSVKIVNNSTRTIRNFILYQQGYNTIGGTGSFYFDVTIEAGSSATGTNVQPGNYVNISSATYQGYKVDKNTTFTVTAGQTTTVTITNSDLVSSN